jgi:hypothetical protein
MEKQGVNNIVMMGHQVLSQEEQVTQGSYQFVPVWLVRDQPDRQGFHFLVKKGLTAVYEKCDIIPGGVQMSDKIDGLTLSPALREMRQDKAYFNFVSHFS